MNVEKSDRINWFFERIGKRVFRTRFECCETCDKNYETGVIIEDEMIAHYYYLIEGEIGVKYFDTKEERDEFEKSCY